MPPDKPRPTSQVTLAGRHALSYGLPLAVLSALPLLRVDDDALAWAGVAVALLHWFWRPLAATAAVLAVILPLAAANAIKKTYTGETIIWQDLGYVLPGLADNLGTLIQYFDYGVLVAPVLLAAAAIVAVRFERGAPTSPRLAAGFSALLLLLYAPQALSHAWQVADDLAAARRSVSSFSGHHVRSSVARFIHSLSLPAADLDYQPVGTQHFRRWLPPKGPQEPAAPAGGPFPDIFAVFQESQLHPKQFADCTTHGACAMEMFEPGATSRALGPLHVHTVGWGTWNAEFAFMTGTPHTWYKGAGQYSPYTSAPRVQMALGHHLNALGYRTIVIYPTQKGMLNALNAYRSYGVQEFYGAEDLDLSLDWCRLPDSRMYEVAENVYRQARARDARPVFILLLTIFNHGPHGERCAAPEHTIAAGDPPQVVADKKLADFLARSRQADAASRAFRNKMLAADRDTVILIAGDHQPGFEGLAHRYARRPHRAMAEDAARYFTDYQIFANRPTEQRTVQRELDITFLSSTLLEQAGLPLGPLFTANLTLRDLCQGRLDVCPDAPHLLDSYRQHLSEAGFYR